MSDITKLIEVLAANHQEQDRRQHMAEQARQSREQEKKHAEEMAVLIEQVILRDTEMKRLIEVVRDGDKRSSTAVASFEPFDSSLELWLNYLERFRTFLTANSIPREKEAQVFSDQPDYSNLQFT